MRPGPVPRAARALACAVLAVAAALGAAVGPAHHQSTTIIDPPPDAPRVAGAASFRPALLAEHRPAHLAVDVDCAVFALASPEVTELFGSTRDPGIADRLSLRRRPGVLEAALGAAVVLQVPAAVDLVDTAAPACRVRLEIDARDLGDATWSLVVAGAPVASADAAPPVVSGFAVGAAAGDLRVELRTRETSSRPSTRQWALVLVALGAAVAAVASLRTSSSRTSSPVRRGLDRVDVLVIVATVVWWLLGPWYFDDGWLMATVRAREGTGSFGNYFDTLGAQMPLGLVHHVLLWPFAALDAPFLLWRAVPAAATVLTWLVVRRVHEATFGPRAAVPTLAAAHLVFLLAWSMTLRPEPMVALLGALALAAVVRHRETDGMRLLALAGIAVALAVSMHPSGIVAAAPVVLLVGPVTRRARRDAAACLEVLAASGAAAAVGVVALFADTDLARWRADRGAFAGDGFHSRGVRDELDRYHDLLTNATVPQLASVLVAAVALVALLLGAPGRRRRGAAADAWPARFGAVLLAGVVLLSFTPSKWTYHFGSLAPAAVLAIAADAARSRGNRARLVHTVVLALVAARVFTDQHDPQYFLQLDVHRPAWLGSRLVWLGLIAVALLVPRVRTSVGRGAPAAVLGVTACASLVLYAIGPAVQGPAWATGRALLDDVVHAGCPFADAVAVTDVTSAEPLARLDAPGTFVLGPDREADVIVVLRAPEGTPAATLEASWSDASGLARAPHPSRRTVPSFAPSIYGPAPATRPVRFAARDVPGGATTLVLRVVAGDAASATPEVVAVLAARPAALSSLLRGRRVLVSPPQLPLLRCTTPPRVHAGVAEAPDVVVGFERRAAVDEIPELGSPTGPWFLAADAYATRVVWGWLDDTDAFAVTLVAPWPAAPAR